MKSKLYLAALALSIPVLVMGQQNKTAQILPKQAMAVDISAAKPNAQTTETSRGSGIPIWSSDFSNAADWIVGNTGNPPANWVIGSAPPSGFFSTPMGAINAPSGAPFAMFDSDGLGNDFSIQNAWIQVAQPINFSGFGGVNIEFKSYYRRFQGNCYVEVSTNGTAWQTIQVHSDISVNGITANPATVILNVSSTLANAPMGYVRFRYEGGWDYAWMIDDVEIYESPEFDIALTSAFYDEYILTDITSDFADVDYIQHFEYNSYQKGQVRPLTFVGFVENVGSGAVTNAKLLVSVQTPSGTEQFESAGVTVASGSTATLTIPNVVLAAFADGGTIGNYTVSFSTSIAEQDANSANNTLPNKTFSVNNERMQNDRGSVWSTFYPAIGQDCTWGNRFMYENPGQANYIQFALISTTQVQTAPGEIIHPNVRTGSVFEPEGPANVIQPFFGETDIEYVVAQADLTTGNTVNWITVMLPTTISLQPGVVYQPEVFIPAAGGPVVWLANVNEQETFAGSLELFSPTQTAGGTLQPGIYTLGQIAPCIRMGFMPNIGVEGPSDIDFKLGQNFPNPSNGTTAIEWELLKPARNVQFQITDVTGKLVYAKNLGDRPAGVQERIELNLNLAAGNYQYSLIVGNERIVRRMVIVK
jgi:hypothetical protein